MSEDEIVEILDPTAFEGDPDKVIRERITPRALQRLYESLAAGAPAGVLDKAIDKAIKIDKRIREKDPVPAQTLAVFNFDPKYLETMGSGIKAMFGGPSGKLEPPRPADDDEGVHG